MLLSQMWNFKFTSEVSDTRIMRRSAGEGDGACWNIQLTGDGILFKILLSEYITIMQEVKGKDGAEGQKTVETEKENADFRLLHT